MTVAAALSVQLLADSGAMPLRVVLAGVVKSDAPQLTDEGDFVLERLPRAALSAIYVDELEASKDVNVLLTLLRQGKEPNDEKFEKVEERLLLWHDPAELDDLIEAYPH